MLRQFWKTLLGQQAYRSLAQTLRSLKIILHPKFEPEVAALAQLVKPGDVAFDIGANYGQYTRVLSRLVGPVGRVFAFEPAALTMQGLERTCRLLKLRNVTLTRTALSSQSGTAILYTPIKAHGGYGVALAHLEYDPRRPSVSETVPTTTLDEFVALHALQRLDFLKCDVEGAELTVLQSGSASLRRFQPKILAEVNQNYLHRHRHSTVQLHDFLSSLGYRACIWHDDRLQPVPSLDAANNYFFLPGN